MNIDPIAARPLSWPVPPSLSAPAEGRGAAQFDQMMLGEVSNLNGQLLAADVHLRSLAAGKTEQLHEAMMGMEQARLSFQFLAQVRNRFLDAYQQLMQMQI